MAKTRLNAEKRQMLTELARQKTGMLLADDKRHVEALAAECRAAATDYAKNRWDPAVLAVLDRFDMIEFVDTIEVVVGTEFRHQRIDFRAELDVSVRWPVAPRKFTVAVLPKDHPIVIARFAWKAARNSLDTAMSNKCAPYFALIQSARTFEDVVEVWPEAEELRSAICGPGTAIATITPAIVESIKQDMVLRAELAEEHGAED